MKIVVGVLVIGLVVLTLSSWGADDGADAHDRSGRDGGGLEFSAPGSGDNGGAPAPMAAGNGGPSSTAVSTVRDDAETNPSSASEEAEAPKIKGPGVIKDDPLADVVFGVLRDVIKGEIPSDRRADAEGRLEAILEQEKMGTEELRQQAAVVAVSTMFRQVDQFGAVSGELSDFQVLAIKAQSNEFAIDFYRKLPMEGQSEGHTGALRAAVEIEIPDGFQRASWEILGGFEYEEGMMLPDSVQGLSKKKVGIAGYMMTLEEVEDIHEFLLVESLWSCCFGIPPEVHQVIVVTIPHERGVEFTTAPILILGELDVGEEVEDGFVTSVYRVEATKVREAE